MRKALNARYRALLISAVLVGLGGSAFAKNASLAQLPDESNQKALPQLRVRPSAGPYCGLYSLWACLSALGVEFDPDHLATSEYVGSQEGSSGSELMKAAEACGAHVDAFTQLNVENLACMDVPMILHVRSTGSDSRYRHWMAYLGMDGKRVRVLDAPHASESLSHAELMAIWDGMALAISARPIGHSVIWIARVQLALNLVLLGCIGYIIRFLGGTRSGLDVKLCRHGICRVLLHGAGLIAIAAVAGLVYHTMTQAGFLRNPSAVAEVARRFYSTAFPEQSFAEMSAIVLKENATIIDARRGVDFRIGAIPGAVNVAVDMNLTERREALRGVSRSTPIVVYCQSFGCRYSDEIADFLRFNGYNHISIYRGGYREWESRATSAANHKLHVDFNRGR